MLDSFNHVCRNYLLLYIKLGLIGEKSESRIFLKGIASFPTGSFHYSIIPYLNIDCLFQKRRM